MKNFKIIKNLIKAFFLMQKRSKGSLFFMYFFPVFIFLFLGYIFGNVDNANINAITIGFDKKFEKNLTPQFQLLKSVMEKSNLFKIKYIDFNLKEEKIINNKIYAFFTLKQSPENKTVLELYVSKKNNQINSIITSFLDKTNLTILKNLKNTTLPFEYTINPVKQRGQPFKYIYFLFAGMIAISLMQNSFFAIPSTIVSYRKMGFLKRFLFTPLKKYHFTIGLILQRFITGVIQTIILFIAAIVFFKIHININIFTFLISFIIGTFTFSAIGFFLAGIIQSEETSNAIAQILNMVLMFTSGVYFPLEIMPKFFVYVAYTNPVYHFTKLLYSSMLLGQNLYYAYINLITLVGMLILFFMLTILTFKYQEVT